MRLTIGDIVCVDDDRKWTFNTQTVVQTDNDTRIIVNSRYFPSNGIANDVGGIISASSKKNTVNDTRMLMQSVTLITNYKNAKIKHKSLRRKHHK